MNRLLLSTKVAIKGKGVLEGSTLFDAATKSPKCHRFSRIPYALPPTAHRRWRKPDPLPSTFSYGSETEPGQYMKPSYTCPQLALGMAFTSSYREDCLHLNIWVPTGKAPETGWPVLFYIHGGFLQIGSNDMDDPSALISDTDVKCIVVSPNYRLGVLGFLAANKICGNGDSLEANFGFWDQRLALEWTHENISSFGGDPENITVGGLSAGSYATFHQLAHDIGPQNPSGKQIIKRVITWSNGCGVQPKPIDEAQTQFDELLLKLNISGRIDATQKIEELRKVSVENLIKAVEKMSAKFFRPVADGQFISRDLLRDIYSGAFGRRMKELGIQIMVGDLTQEFHLYKMAYPPKTLQGLVARLRWDFPRDIVDAVCKPYKGMSMKEHEWAGVFGRLYADLQIHSTMRGFVKCIAQELPASQIYRYRIDWRTESVDKRLPRELGATHATDLSIWLYGNGDNLTDAEKPLLQEWLKPMADFVKGDKVGWGTDSVKRVRYLSNEGKIEIRDDEVWDEKLLLWNRIEEVTKSMFGAAGKAKL